MGLFINLEDDIKNLPKKTILNDLRDIPNITIESYELYNKSIDMINNNCFTSAIKTLESAKLINSNDEDITIALGLLNLLFCNFDEACEYFYKSYRNTSNNLSKKYIDIIISDKFKKFLEIYNLGLIKVNEKKYDEAIKIFLNIVDKESSLIEVYIILYSIYEVIGDNIKKDECIDLIKFLDRDNEILDNLYKNTNISKSLDEKQKLTTNHKNKNIKVGIFIIMIVVAFSGVGIKYKLNQSVVEEKDESTKYEEHDNENYKEEENKNEIDKEDVYEVNRENSDQIENIDLSGISEEELLNKANNFKHSKDYEEAIKIYKNIIRLNKNPDMVSEAVYQVAILNEKIKNYDEAIEYYDKYIDKYSTSYPYYDESYYNIAMIYYENNNKEKSKKYLSELIIKDPKSIYNNTKVKEIIDN